MSMSYADNKLRVPPGFEHLLEGFAREILREQPKNLLEFAALYFSKKLQERDGGSGDSVQTQLTQDTPGEQVVPSEKPIPTANVEDSSQTAASDVAANTSQEDSIVPTADELDTQQAIIEDSGNIVNVDKEQGDSNTETAQEDGDKEEVLEESEGGDGNSNEADENVKQSTVDEPGESIVQPDKEIESTADAVAEDQVTSVSQQNISDLKEEKVEEENSEVVDEQKGDGKASEEGKEKDGETEQAGDHVNESTD